MEFELFLPLWFWSRSSFFLEIYIPSEFTLPLIFLLPLSLSLFLFVTSFICFGVQETLLFVLTITKLVWLYFLFSEFSDFNPYFLSCNDDNNVFIFLKIPSLYLLIWSCLIYRIYFTCFRVWLYLMVLTQFFYGV